MGFRVATVNVNGIRAAARRGLGDWLRGCGADALLLQEVRALPDEVPDGLFDGWAAVHAVADRPGRNGVAVLTRAAPAAVRESFGAPEFDRDGRWLEVDVELGGRAVTLVSVYVPKGDAGTPAQQAKARFCDRMRDRMRELRDAGRPALVAGDLNVAHTERDIRAWKANRAHAGFLPDERAWYGDLLADGWHDVVRERHPEVDGPYSWWSWRGKAFDSDAGWRIDVVLTTPDLAADVSAARVDRAPSYAARMSDHAPVVVDL